MTDEESSEDFIRRMWAVDRDMEQPDDGSELHFTLTQREFTRLREGYSLFLQSLHDPALDRARAVIMRAAALIEKEQ